VRTTTHGRVFPDALPISPADRAKISHLKRREATQTASPKVTAPHSHVRVMRRRSDGMVPTP
jgi:hypothetical protein